MSTSKSEPFNTRLHLMVTKGDMSQLKVVAKEDGIKLAQVVRGFLRLGLISRESVIKDRLHREPDPNENAE